MLRKLMIGLSFGAMVNAVSAVEIDEFQRMRQYFSTHYYALIADLLEGKQVKRSDLIGAYAGDSFFKEVGARNGYK